MFLPFLVARDSSNSSADDSNYGWDYSSPWWNWGRWVLLAVVIVFVVATALSFVAKRNQIRHQFGVYAEDPNIPLGPVYPHDPTMVNPPPPKYEPEGEAYMGPAPAWTPPQQQPPEKGHAGQYGPPPGPPPAAAVAGSSSPSPSAPGPSSSTPSASGTPSGYRSTYYAPPATYGNSMEVRM